MGAPCWSLEERAYFVDVILPMSKYAGGTYSKPEGLGWGELAAIMQEELDRRGASRRKYTSDMLFQHYYQKVSSRSYKRGEGDKMVVPSSNSGSMNPPPRPTPTRQSTPSRRPATKKPSKRVVYASTSTQTQIAIEAGSESERAIQGYPQYAGTLVARHDPPVAPSNFEVQPVASSSRKRQYEATVRNATEDGDLGYEFIMKDEGFEAKEEPVIRKKKTTRARANGCDVGRSRPQEDIFNNIDDISQLLGTESPDPERVRPSKLQNPWAKLSGIQSRTSFGSARRFESPSSDHHSAGTSTIAYKTCTPTPSFELPSSISDTSRLPRPSMIKALFEEQARPSSQASDRSDGFQFIPCPLRESSRNSNGEELGIRGSSNIIRSFGVGPSQAAYRYREDSTSGGFIRSPIHSPRRESSRYATYTEMSETPAITRGIRRETTPLPATPSVEDDVDEWYPAGRPASPFGPTHYQGSRVSNEDTYHDNEPASRSEARSSRPSPSPEQDNGSTPNSVTTRRPITSGVPLLPSFRIRKRSQQQPSASFEQLE
jgi:hypothetical protein